MPVESNKSIVIVANSAWYIYNFRLSLIKALRKDDWQVYVVAPADDFINYLYELDFIKFIPLHRLERKGLNPIRDYRLYRELKKIYSKVNPTVILQYTIKPNIYGSFAAKRLEIPCISVIPGLGYAFSKKGWLRTMSKALYANSLPSNVNVIFENSSDAEYFMTEGIANRDRTVTFKGCGVDTEYFHPMKALKNGTTTKFLFMGRLIWEKGIYEFVEAAKLTHERFPNSRFWVIGHIDEENPSAVPNDTFVSWIEHPAIKYHGFSRDVRQIVREVDCVVLPSYYPEGVPRVLQEGMAMGKPIVTTDSDGCREAVEDGHNGFLVEPRSIGDLAVKMSRICEMSPQELALMGANGRQKAIQEFDEHISIARYMEIINAGHHRGGQ